MLLTAGVWTLIFVLSAAQVRNLPKNTNSRQWITFDQSLMILNSTNKKDIDPAKAEEAAMPMNAHCHQCSNGLPIPNSPIGKRLTMIEA
tara:strand:- start:224 stop:490 length:267 start_codon:yes stop_codon:yes gene_type:complete